VPGAGIPLGEVQRVGVQGVREQKGGAWCAFLAGLGPVGCCAQRRCGKQDGRG
jgi:hypothetical protein